MTRALVALVALALALPATSLAKAPQTNAPPGNSAIDEYLETVPGASGSSDPRSPGGGGSSSGAGSSSSAGSSSAGSSSTGGGLTPTQRARLEQHGADGKTLADAVDATSSGKTSKEERALPKSDGRSPLGEVFGAATGSNGGGGMGIVLPAIIIGALLVFVFAVLLRRRATS